MFGVVKGKSKGKQPSWGVMLGMLLLIYLLTSGPASDAEDAAGASYLSFQVLRTPPSDTPPSLGRFSESFLWGPWFPFGLLPRLEYLSSAAATHRKDSGEVKLLERWLVL